MSDGVVKSIIQRVRLMAETKDGEVVELSNFVCGMPVSKIMTLKFVMDEKIVAVWLELEPIVIPDRLAGDSESEIVDSNESKGDASDE